MEASWKRLGGVQRYLSSIAYRFFKYRAILENEGRLGRLGSVLEASWGRLGGILGRLGGVLGASWRRLGAVVGI